MMAVSAREVAFAEELFAGLGDLTVKRLFGGAGLYSEGVIFGAIMDETVYLKAGAALIADLEVEGSTPWVYTYPSGPKAGQTIPMGYWSLPEAALDDPQEACDWARRALKVALQAKDAKQANRRKRQYPNS